ncbi:TetR/AcrR family transcriptional regulator [Kutzneria sp. NPDC052558]|uniref:TetR/AcrR family transcriptional regulator n=1 Tax=Kutzneria sp. NPDC052558 TaxID=3364121 RepID=UPI0037CC857E
MAAKNVDLRREAGRRTRDQLLTVAMDLLAERGPEGVTLREITEAAGANVAAVSYHFGSLKVLCETAAEHALERYLDAQQQAMSALAPGSTLLELAAAFARPMVDALSAGGHDLAVMRTVARFGADPPEGWNRLDDKFDETRADAMRVLARHLPGIEEPDLVFRLRCAAGMINWLALAPIGAELAGRSAEQIERQLLPVLAGALRGDPTPPGL